MLPRPDRRHHRSPTMLMRFPLLPMVLAYCSSLEGLHATIYVFLIRDFIPQRSPTLSRPSTVDIRGLDAPF